MIPHRVVGRVPYFQQISKRVLFRPLKRTYYLGVFPFQGLFPARQEEISREYAAMLSTEVIGPKDLVAHVVARGGDRLVAVATATLERTAAGPVPYFSMAACAAAFIRG